MDAIQIEIGATIDKKLIAAFKSLEQRVVSLDKGLTNIRHSLTFFEKLSGSSAVAALGLSKAFGKLSKAMEMSAKHTDALYQARNREMSSARRSINLAEQEAAAHDKSTKAIKRRAKAESGSGKGGVRGYLNSRGQGGGFPIGTAALGGALGGSTMEAAGFNYRNQLIANTDDLTDKDRDIMAEQIKALSGAHRTNQTTKELQEALDIYASAGLKVMSQGLGALESTGKMATAYGISSADVATTNAAAMANLGITPEQIPAFGNILSAGGKAGSFEVKDFAQYFGGMSANMKDLGIQGLEGAKYMVAAMQAIRVGSPNGAAADTNFQNLKAKIFSPETNSNFDTSYGFDMAAFVEEVQKGKAGSEGQYGGNVMAAFVAKTKELTGGKMAEIAKIAKDEQYRNGLLALVNNTEKFNDAMQGAEHSTGVFENDFARTMRTTVEQIKTAKIAVLDMANSLGDTLGPSVSAIVKDLRPFVESISKFIKENPEVIATTIKFSLAIAAVNLALGPAVKLFHTGAGIIKGFNTVLGGLARSAPAAGEAAGEALGSGISDETASKLEEFFSEGGGFGKIVKGVSTIAAAAAAGYAVGTTVGEYMSQGMVDKFNADNDRNFLKDAGFSKMADTLSNTSSANAEDKAAAFALLSNPYAREGIQKQLDTISKSRPSFQASRSAFAQRVANLPKAGSGLFGLTPRSADDSAVGELEKVSGEIEQMDAAERILKGRLGTLDYMEKFKARDPAALRQALDANSRLTDSAAKVQAGLPTTLTGKEKNQLQAIRDIAIHISGVGNMNPEELATKIKEMLHEENANQQSDQEHSSRAAQDTQLNIH